MARSPARRSSGSCAGARRFEVGVLGLQHGDLGPQRGDLGLQSCHTFPLICAVHIDGEQVIERGCILVMLDRRDWLAVAQSGAVAT
jgi:hypothetical protein